jgi:hypothetical protein
MWRFTKKMLGFWLALGLVLQASAFSMLGPYATDSGFLWQTGPLGYQQVGDIGGPMNIAQGYRFNVHNLYYAFDPTFLQFFGTRGAEEVEKAIKVLNDLPPVSQINMDDYPLRAERYNQQASALLLLDVKTATLITLVEEMGLAECQRYVFTLRNRWVDSVPQTNYTVIRRNFDPVTLRPSSYINGDLWTYTTILDVQSVPYAAPQNSRVDPLAYGDSVASAYGFFTGSIIGRYFTSLTRDDIGGLRYLYSPLTRHVEAAPTNSFGGFAGSVPTSGGGTGGGSPWNPVFAPSTNALGATNVITAPVGTNFIADPVIRGGVDKIRFVRLNYDSLVGQALTPVLDSWTDAYITNGVLRSQAVLRWVVLPDILFSAADFTGDGGALPGASPGAIARNASFRNEWALNTSLAAPQNAGPGTVQPGIIITYNTVGPMLFNGPWPFNLSEDTGIPFVLWGSFDGTTNAPVLYPNSITIGDLEQLILGGR